MHESLKEFCDNLIYWLATNHEIEARVTKEVSATRVVIGLWAEDDLGDDEDSDEEGGNFHVGSNADPGLTITWIGALPIPDWDNEKRPREFVEANGVIMERLGRDVAGWVAGRE